jgi:hypothetical protein
MAAKSEGRKYQVGDRVRFRHGAHFPLATIVEDRGMLADRGRRRLYRVKVEVDPPNFFFTEVPEDRLFPAQAPDGEPQG